MAFCVMLLMGTIGTHGETGGLFHWGKITMWNGDLSCHGYRQPGFHGNGAVKVSRACSHAWLPNGGIHWSEEVLSVCNALRGGLNLHVFTNTLVCNVQAGEGGQVLDQQYLAVASSGEVYLACYVYVYVLASVEACDYVHAVAQDFMHTGCSLRLSS